MKTIVALFVLLLSVTAQAAPKFATVFYGSYFIAGRKTVIDNEGNVRLPGTIATAGWSCSITTQNLTDDGLKTYRNIACSNRTSLIRATASCPVSAVGSDVANFSLMVSDEDRSATIEFYLTCNTAAKGGPTRAPAPSAADQDI